MRITENYAKGGSELRARASVTYKGLKIGLEMSAKRIIPPILFILIVVPPEVRGQLISLVGLGG